MLHHKNIWQMASDVDWADNNAFLSTRIWKKIPLQLNSLLIYNKYLIKSNTVALFDFKSCSFFLAISVLKITVLLKFRSEITKTWQAEWHVRVRQRLISVCLIDWQTIPTTPGWSHGQSYQNYLKLGQDWGKDS